MNTDKFSNTLHALALKFRNSTGEILKLKAAGQTIDEATWSAHGGLGNHISGLCYSARMLLSEDELHQLIYRTGLTQEVFERAASEIEKEVGQ